MNPCEVTDHAQKKKKKKKKEENADVRKRAMQTVTIYIYIYICVCVCVCVCMELLPQSQKPFILTKWYLTYWGQNGDIILSRKLFSKIAYILKLFKKMSLF